MHPYFHRFWERSNSWRASVLKWSRRIVVFLGCVALLLILLAFTRFPYEAHRWLGTAAGVCMDREPQVVLVLGGSGMPSGNELLRLYHASEWAVGNAQAQVIVMHPLDTLVMTAMVEELVLRGVAHDRIHEKMKGTNTREQAITLFRDHPGWRGQRIAIVTAPENMYRSVSAFRKAGFNRVCGAPAWDTPMFTDLDYAHRALGGKAYVPDVSGSNALRYDVWNRLKLEITCIREGFAIGYYKLNAWI